MVLYYLSKFSTIIGKGSSSALAKVNIISYFVASAFVVRAFVAAPVGPLYQLAIAVHGDIELTATAEAAELSYHITASFC